MPIAYTQRETLTERLARWSRPAETGCILWVGAVHTFGHGLMSYAGRRQSAHRFAWESIYGPIPEGMCVCHRCDVPACINPDHLFLGTRDDNNKDMAAKARTRRGAVHHNSKLSVAQVSAIRLDTRPQPIIAAEHGINQSTVSRIKTRERRLHI